MKEKFSIIGMTCAACSAGIEKTIKKLDGIRSVEVSLMGECMLVDYDEQILSVEKIFQSVEQLGYGISQYDNTVLKGRKSQDNSLKKRFLISLLIMLPLMYCSMGGMVGLPTPMPAVNYCLQAILSLAIMAVNRKFFMSGASAFLKRVPNMDSLVSLGSAVSWVYSVVLTVLYFVNGQQSHMYYESAAMILTFVTLGKWLEDNSKRKTGNEVEKLIALMPKSVTIESNGIEKVIEFSKIEKGDILIVRQGDYIPVDGRVLEGHGFIDRAAITGESLPIEVVAGDCVTGADIVKSGYFKVVAERVGQDTTLSQIVQMVKNAGASKAPLQKIADRIAGVFVPVVCFLALLTFVVWLGVTGDFSLAANYAISVLVISCPCSLGLATPVAVMAATGRGMSLGILYKDAEALQKAKDINCVLLDKTATLTEGEPKVQEFECFTADKPFILGLAYAIECLSNHPLADCIKRFVENQTFETLSISNYHYHVGKGATAEYAGERYCLGNRKLLDGVDAQRAEQIENKYSKQGKTVVFLANKQQILSVFVIADTLKETSCEAVQTMKAKGLRVAMLTGDNENVAEAIAKSVGIDEYFAEALPEDKAKSVERVRSVGGVVAMVGDGINDSPALKTADIGVAMGTGADIAIDSADVVLVSGDLRSIATMVDLSKSTVRNIKQNLFWAFFYNVVAIPIAAGAFAWAHIHLNPMIAVACMSLSSLFVVSNALRLMAFQRKKEAKNQTSVIENTVLEQEHNMGKIIKIEGMMCKHCVAHVIKALTSIDGVDEVNVSLEDGTATVMMSSVVDDAVFVSSITDAGYEVVSINSTK